MKKILTNGSDSVAEFVKALDDQKPDVFSIQNTKHPKMSDNTNDYYYVVKLASGKTAILQAGILVAAYNKGVKVFTSKPVPGKEVELSDNARLGVKAGRWVVETA